jgi:hypothetical protein
MKRLVTVCTGDQKRKKNFHSIDPRKETLELKIE